MNTVKTNKWGCYAIKFVCLKYRKICDLCKMGLNKGPHYFKIISLPKLRKLLLDLMPTIKILDNLKYFFIVHVYLKVYNK